MERKFYNNPQDKGAVQKNIEVTVRLAISPKTKVLKCQEQGKADHRCKYQGTMVNVEIKCGCGKVAYNVNPEGPAEAHIPNIYPDMDYIVYIPETYEGMDILTEAWVLTRKQFLDFLTNYPKPMVKYNSYNGTTDINIQSFNSKRKQQYLWEILDAMPTLGEWLEER